MTLDQYLASRFGPVFDALNDAGGVPEELMECLKRGAVWQLAETMTEITPNSERSDSLGRPDGLSLHFNVSYSKDEAVLWFGGRTNRDEKHDPESLFPHLSHLIEQEV